MIEYPGDEIEQLPKPGETVAAGYTVVRTLGVGGMGAVLEVESEELGGRCALKIMLPSLTDDVEFKARFERESRISQLVDSEHVVRVLDVGSLPDGRLFMAMELLAGHDLAAEIDARGALPIAEAVGVVLQACDALHEAHKQGIVHRDLKPANLFLATRPGGDRIVKLLDFGISKKLGSTSQGDGPSLTGTDSVLGSPKYMSPEQIRNAKGVDGRADIWSLGVILYKLLLDRHPYRGESLGEYVTILAFEPPTPIDPGERSIPDELATVIMRCIEKKPEGRYRTVARLAADLAPWAPPSVAHILERMRRDEPSAFPAVAPSRTVAMGATPAPSGALAERAIANVAATPAPAPTRPSKTLGDATVTDGPSIDATVSGTVSESGAGSGAASELRAALAGIRVSTTEVAPPPPRTWRLPIVLALVGVALAGLAVALYLAFGR